MRKLGKLGTVLAVLAVIGAIVAFYLAGTYNSFVEMEENVKNAWSQVETNYQRRADLIPNLVETVKAYATHENETFASIAQLRSSYNSAKTPSEYQELDRQLATNINIMVEAYPELKANSNFLSFQDELAGTENRIAVARRDYNEVTTAFNKKVRVFPQNIVAGLFNFESKELFAAEAGAEKAPKVDFGNNK